MDRYKKYSPKAQEWLNRLITTLKKQCDGELPESYYVTLDLIADSVDMYFTALEQVKKDGITIKDKRGIPVKHPAISVINNSQLFIQRMLNASGLTALSAAKLKKGDVSNPSELDEFLDD